ncbi:MAG TPA: response regulator [Myxococcota bacterium]|jgi:hypothetical protein
MADASSSLARSLEAALRAAADWFVPASLHASGRDTLRAARTLVGAALIIVSAATAVIASNAALPRFWLALLSAQVLGIAALPIVLRATGALRRIQHTMVLQLFVLLLSGAVASLGRGPGLAWLWGAPAAALLLLGRRAAFAWTLASALALAGFAALAASDLPASVVYTPSELARANRREGLLMIAAYLTALLLIDRVREAALRDRERGAAELLESRTWYHRLVNATPDAILVFDEGRVVYANQRAVELWECGGADELLGRRTEELVSEQDLEVLGSVREQIRRGEAVSQTRYTARTSRGKRIPVETRSTPTEFQGRPATLSVVRDVTREDRALEQLRLFAATVEQADSLLCAVDSRGIVRFANAAWRRKLGVPGQDPTGLHWQAASRPETHAQSFELGRLFYRTREGRYSEDVASGMRSHWEYRQISVMAPGEEEPVTVFVNRDITHQVALEERMRESQRMEPVGRLAGGVAHRLNNLLTVVLGRAETLGERLPPDARAQADLEAIREAAQGAATVARQLLAFARRTPVESELIDVNQALSGARELLGSGLPPEIALELELAPDLPPVLIDRSQLQSALVSFVLSARDRIDGAGTIRLETASGALPGELAREGEASQRFVLLRIRDDGRALDSGAREHLFEPFNGGAPDARSTGLELPSAHGTVVQGGGRIAVESAPGVGTTVTVFLPAAPPSAAEPAAAPLAQPQPGGGRVLVVDDEPAVRAIARRALERAGYEVLEAAGGEQALALIASEPRALDLVVTDLAMPGLSGIALAEQLAQQRPDLPVVFLTGYSSVVTEYHLPSATRSVLTKPYSGADLVARVRELIKRPAREGE